MTFENIIQASRRVAAHLLQHGVYFGTRRPLLLGSVVLATGLAGGLGAGIVMNASLRAQVTEQQAMIELNRREAQREVNALAARLGELQAEANRLNALGERLTRIGQLEDGEFDFDKPVGIGGVGPVEDIARPELDEGLEQLGQQFSVAGEQLSVLESLLFNRQLDLNAVPSRTPVGRSSYITSHFGYRADPFSGGRALHKGVDFSARTGDPVYAVADGVISFSGARSGYGKVVEVDHGNGYVTRYAHNSKLTRKAGELVRAGQEVAKAGSTGRSTGAHVHFEVWENGKVVNPRNFLSQQSPLKG
ncbi:M23 family metallopeptidase [Marilutibacter alkalisoli]|uniref:M23 family metallopeptidase n=1 Tax=Marilutibacter alkalisoli TaxID=2591633 RepID=A0A514BUA1_9GAMM|nr:M23 family metallopeptidase [Lysobacter alkalisoli]QDH70946.1 M23 family metallopeptidase [Lysobacter alkalisoli]